MMKKILIGLGLLVGIVVIFGLLLPKDYTIEREIVIQQPKAAVFAEVRSLKSQNTWSPWGKLDPNMKLEFRGTDGQVGFVSAWSGNKEVGVGEQEITKIVEGERMETELRFKEPFADTGYGWFATEAVSEKETKVKWGMRGRTPFPMNLLCFVMNMQGMLARDFDKGLAALKEKLEKGQ